VIALEHESVRIDVDLTSPDDQSTCRHALHLVGLLTSQNVVALVRAPARLAERRRNRRSDQQQCEHAAIHCERSIASSSSAAASCFCSFVIGSPDLDDQLSRDCAEHWFAVGTDTDRSPSASLVESSIAAGRSFATL
jgi:hypothetical protein